MTIIMIILVGIIVILLLSLFLINKEIKNIVKQLEQYNQFKSRKKLDVNLFNKNIENLAECINHHMEISKELQIKQSQSEQELKRMISAISHDLRTPLTSISGYLQMLQKDDLPVEKKKRYLDVATSRSRDLQDLINQFFMLSVIEDTSYQLELESIDLKENFVQILSGFYDEFINKQIELDIQVCDEEVCILGHEASVRRVIENLMINISKHSQGDAKIILKTDESFAHLLIIDSISNSNELKIENLFDKFYKADHSRKVNSTGLGLTIVKELMIKMQGNVSANVKGNELHISCRWELK